VSSTLWSIKQGLNGNDFYENGKKSRRTAQKKAARLRYTGKILLGIPSGRERHSLNSKGHEGGGDQWERYIGERTEHQLRVKKRSEIKDPSHITVSQVQPWRALWRPKETPRKLRAFGGRR